PSALPPRRAGLRLPAGREADAEPGAGAGRALDVDPAAVLGDDPVANAQAEPGPAADRLGGEERLRPPPHRRARGGATPRRRPPRPGSTAGWSRTPSRRPRSRGRR